MNRNFYINIWLLVAKRNPFRDASMTMMGNRGRSRPPEPLRVFLENLSLQPDHALKYRQLVYY